MAVVICRILYFVWLGWYCTLIYKMFHPRARSPYRVVEDTRQGMRQRIRNIHTRNSPGRTEKLIKRLREYKHKTNGALPTDPHFRKESGKRFSKITVQADKLSADVRRELVILRACLKQLVEAEDYEAAAKVRDYIDELAGFQLYHY